jgi:hypothetical protein
MHTICPCRLRDVNFSTNDAAFLGHVLRKDGILTQDSKISAIKNWSPLTDIRSVRVFVSLCSYYRKYIWCFAEISAPLTDLLKDWTVVLALCPRRACGCRESAVCARQQSPALAYFDVHSAATDLYCDASDDSIGSVLQQTDRDGNVRPVGFYSRKLTPSEGRYGTNQN